jgi:hypothetical protein
MKKVLWIFTSALLLSNLFVSTGCGDDTTDPINNLAPIVVITDGPSAETVVGQDAIVTVKVEATKGTGALKTLTVLESGTKISLDRITIDGAAAAANPLLLVNPTDEMTWTIGIDVHDAFDKRTYTVRVEDDNGLNDEITFDVTVQEANTEINGVLLNQMGPAGTGGIDLETGTGTGTSAHAGDPTNEYLKADLRDMGIRPGATTGDNWAKRVGGINGSEVRYLDNPTELSFDNVKSKQGVIDAFNAGAVLTEEISTFPGVKVSKVVVKGDVFMVKSGEKYFLVRVDDVIETLTLGDNTDNYKLSIKF